MQGVMDCGQYAFLADVSECWFNKEFCWYEGSDPNIGSHGYFAIHRTVQLFIQMRNLKEVMKDMQKVSPKFAAHGATYDNLSAQIKSKKDIQRNNF